VFDTKEGRRVATVPLNGEWTDNAARDIAAMAPGGDRIFVALPGPPGGARFFSFLGAPTPLSRDPHNATGSTPGLGVISLLDGGRSGRLTAIVRMTNVTDGAERSDPHAVAVRSLR
jgi:hypothetical protein